MRIVRVGTLSSGYRPSRRPTNPFTRRCSSQPMRGSKPMVTRSPAKDEKHERPADRRNECVLGHGFHRLDIGSLSACTWPLLPFAKCMPRRPRPPNRMARASLCGRTPLLLGDSSRIVRKIADAIVEYRRWRSLRRRKHVSARAASSGTAVALASTHVFAKTHEAQP